MCLEVVELITSLPHRGSIRGGNNEFLAGNGHIYGEYNPSQGAFSKVELPEAGNQAAEGFS